MQIPSYELADSVGELHQSGSNGLLMVFTDRQVATIGFADGQVMLVMFNGLTGRAALSAFQHALRQQPTLTLQFSRGSAGTPQADLPPLPDLLELMRSTETAAQSKPLRQRNSVPVTEAMKPIIRGTASAFLGVHANAICDNIFAHTDSLRAVFLLLSSHLPSHHQPSDLFATLRRHLRPLTEPYLRDE